ARPPERPSPPLMNRDEKTSRPLFALGISTVFGAGYVPFAPGTVGSAAGLGLWAVLPASPLAQAGAIAAVFAVGAWSASAAERHYERVDPSYVVIDEVLGMLITLFMIPAGWIVAVLGFFVFRLADVVKPYPADRFERLPGGVGVMADDAMAAVYSNLALRLIIWLSGHLV